MAVSSVSVSSEIPDFLKPYYEGVPAVGTPGEPGYKPATEGLLSKGIKAIYPDAAGAEASKAAYQTKYSDLIDAGLMGAEGVADMSAYQQLAGQRIGDMAIPGAFADASKAGADAYTGLGALQNYAAKTVTAGPLQNFAMGAGPSVGSKGVTHYQMSGVNPVSARDLRDISMTSAGPVSASQLNQYTMAGPEMFGSDQAQRYMSPYMQNVVDSQSRMAIDAARKAQLSNNLASARQGTYGGARQALLQSEREQGLRTQLGDIQAMGLQKAYEQAQTQFERDRTAGMTTDAKNLEARLGVQGLGSSQGLQAALANQNAAQAAAMKNVDAALATQQLGADQYLRAQLANQGAALDVGKQNLLANLSAQQTDVDAALRAAMANQNAALTAGQQNLAAQLAVQQLGAQQNLDAQKLNQAGDLAAGQLQLDASKGLGALTSTMGNLGVQEFGVESDITKQIGGFGDFQRGITQQGLDAQKGFLTDQANFAQTQVGDMSSLLRGTPMGNTTSTTTTPPPSFGSALAGAGVAGLGVYNMMNKQ